MLCVGKRIGIKKPLQRQNELVSYLGGYDCVNNGTNLNWSKSEFKMEK